MSPPWRRVDPTPPSIPPVTLPDGSVLPVALRRSARARRMAIRLHPCRDGVELVLPPGGSVGQALAFLESRRGWIAAAAARLPPPVPFVEGATIPVLGQPHLLRAAGRGDGRRPVFAIGNGAIEVTGGAEHLARRTRHGLAEHALGLLAAKTEAVAARLGREIGRVTVGDPRTRWGSCAGSGRIRYSWRLVLAPEPVMNYVVAHEAAHLVEMNHSRQFWQVVAGLEPGFAEARAWLRRQGPRLLRFG